MKQPAWKGGARLIYLVATSTLRQIKTTVELQIIHKDGAFRTLNFFYSEIKE